MKACIQKSKISNFEKLLRYAGAAFTRTWF